MSLMLTAAGSEERGLERGDTADLARRVRVDFPLFDRDDPPVYLDSAATSQTPRQVIGALVGYYEGYRANVHRGLYPLAERATAAYEAARADVARFVGAPDPRGVVFTRGCTEAINLVAYAWGRGRLGPGDEVLVTGLEHHSNLVPWQQITRATGASLRFVPLDPEGGLRLEELGGLVGSRTRLVAISGLSNVLGTVTPLAPVISAARSVGALVLVDAAQLVLHRRIDLAAQDIDLLVFSGHKLLGPTGVGALVARPELLEEMDPFLTGGEMVVDVTLDGARWNEVPHRLEAGTPPIAGAIGLGAAIRYVEALGHGRIQAHDRKLREHGRRVLGAVEGLRLYGPPDHEAVATFAFNLHDRRGELIHPHDVATVLASRGVAVRAGHHCAKPLIRHLGVPATVRASAYIYNTTADIDALGAALDAVHEIFG